jgi:hypothetical protein
MVFGNENVYFHKFFFWNHSKIQQLFTNCLIRIGIFSIWAQITGAIDRNFVGLASSACQAISVRNLSKIWAVLAIAVVGSLIQWAGPTS